MRESLLSITCAIVSVVSYDVLYVAYIIKTSNNIWWKVKTESVLKPFFSGKTRWSKNLLRQFLFKYFKTKRKPLLWYYLGIIDSWILKLICKYWYQFLDSILRGSKENIENNLQWNEGLKDWKKMYFTWSPRKAFSVNENHDRIFLSTLFVVWNVVFSVDVVVKIVVKRTWREKTTMQCKTLN